MSKELNGRRSLVLTAAAIGAASLTGPAQAQGQTGGGGAGPGAQAVVGTQAELTKGHAAPARCKRAAAPRSKVAAPW